ncbi:calcium-binding protein [Falsiroseomonas sp. CW058]|uniref:calcium-binding protein n=1 Tax=Falsiroseomonas sp. CW058 TaxID=3388664 RepID=UPI003D30F46A
MATDTPPKAQITEAALDAVTGGNGAERISGTSANNNYSTGYGADTVMGWTGNDTIQAGADNDIAGGQAGNDSVDGGEGTDIVTGGAGTDTVSGGAGSDIIIGGTGADLLMGDAMLGVQGDDNFRWHPGDGNDTIQGGGGTDILVIEDAGMSLQQLLGAIRLDSGSAQPRIESNYINLTGVSGTVTIGGETIRFTGLERMVPGSYQYFQGRQE